MPCRQADGAPSAVRRLRARRPAVAAAGLAAVAIVARAMVVVPRSVLLGDSDPRSPSPAAQAPAAAPDRDARDPARLARRLIKNKWTYRSTTGRPPVPGGGPRPGPAAGPAEPALGTPAHPGRAPRPGLSHRRGNDPPDPGRRRAHARAAPDVTDRRQFLAPPASGILARLPARRRRVPPAPGRVLRDGDRHPSGAHPGHHRPPHPEHGPPGRPATRSWTSAHAPTGSGS